jgi:ATP-binding cassette subfamily B protein
LLRKPMIESSMRLRTHAGALERFYLDSLLGAVPIRVHGAERAVRREHEDLLVEWARTARTVQLQNISVQALQILTSTAVAVVLVASYLAGNGAVTGVLLLAFWALRVPAAGQELALALFAYRNVRNVAMRLFAPLAGPESVTTSATPAPLAGGRGQGVRIDLRGVTACAGGHTILRGLSAEIPAGQHLAVVGASGAGKSSLVGLLLGWLTVSEGHIDIDGERLDGERLARLRREVAWVDPAVQLWHRSLFENVVFGDDDRAIERLPEAMARADLTEVLENLPEGMQADLGEGGVRVSGGQGQRVRLARALMRQGARLVILDEPFRGLERTRRRELLRRVREQWAGATVLFVSHDVGDTEGLDRVLLLDGGRIVEDGAPGRLLADPASRYRALVLADRALHDATWSGARWRRHSMEHGQLSERAE